MSLFRKAAVVAEPIAYRLPVTVVRIQGTRTTTTSSVDPTARPQVEREATVDVDVVADPRQTYELRAPADSGWQDRQLSLTLTTDGRLATAGAELTDRSGERLKAVVTIGAVVAGSLVLGANPITAGAGALVVAAGSLRRAIEELDSDGHSGTSQDDEEQVDEALPKPEELGINPEYETDHPADHALLYAYRMALLRLTLEHATMAGRTGSLPGSVADALKQLDAILKSTRAEAKHVEARYDAWLKSKETRDTKTIVLELYADQLPDEAAFHKQLLDGAGSTPPVWWKAMETVRTMATVDYLDGGTASAPSEAAIAAGSIVYRVPRPATLQTWSVVEKESGYEATRATQDRILVTVPGSEQTIAVSSAKKEGKVEIGLDPSGALISLEVTSNSSAARRAETVAGLPAVVKDALTTGGELAATFDPTQRELQRLERELKIAEANAKLKGPADPDPRLTELQDKLAVAELEARLAAAELIRSDPSRATIVVRTTE
ncbi:hypothetical protein [Kribbella sp. CA-247076]|uniref:hypothetical protein n=1 Tax=Kribbella sp. CA-247076 TaxID=3239941 RepID=UPI003D9390DA